MIALIALAACRGERPLDTWVIAVDAPVKDLDPRMAVDGPSARLSRMVFQGLTQVDDHGTPALDLAQALTEDGDPLVVLATLRGDARFHDGVPVTGQDVAWTYSTVLDPSFGSPIRGEFSKRFRAVIADPSDRRRVRFLLRRPLATLWSDMVLGIAPAHLLRNQPGGRFAGPPVGTGPWRVVGPAAGERVELERVRDQDCGRGCPQHMIFRSIGDEGARALSVLGGGADVAWTGLSPSVLRGAASGGRARLQATPGIAWTYLGLNLRNPSMADQRVRRALALAIDRQTVIDTLMAGLATKADSMFAPGHWARRSLPAVPHDPAQAIALLEEAGLHAGPDGVRLRLELKVSTSRLRRSVARAFAEQWKAVGVDVAVRPFELATFLADVRAGRFELFLLQLPEPFEPDQLSWMFHSANAAVQTPDPDSASPWARLERRLWLSPGAWDPQLSGDVACARWQRTAVRQGLQAEVLEPLGLSPSHGNANRTAWASPWADCWMDLGSATADRSQRAELYGKAQQLIAQELPVISLWWEHQAVLVGRDVQLPELAADGRYAALGRARRR